MKKVTCENTFGKNVSKYGKWADHLSTRKMQKVGSNNPALQPASPVPLASVCVAQKIKKKRKKQKKHYLITTELPSRLYFSFSVIQ